MRARDSTAGIRCAGGQTSAAETFTPQTAPGSSHQKNAIALSNVRGDTRPTCNRCCWVSRYSTSACLTTTVLALHRMTCISLLMGLCILFRFFCKLALTISISQADNCIYLPRCSTIVTTYSSTPSFEATGKAAAISCTGPKSGDAHTRPRASFILLLILISVQITPIQSVCIDARVDADTTAASGAGRHGLLAKRSGIQRTIVSAALPDSTKAGKRSYRRAYARAVRMGGTPYKGRWRPLSWFTPRYIVPQHVGRRPVTHVSAHAWKILSWNAGGLTKEVFQELRTFAAMGEYDIVLVQETKWRHDNMWSDKAYHFVHSQGQGKDDAVAGLLTMISTRLAKAADVQHSAVHNGRLLHVRFPRGQVHVDVLNWYQYAVSDKDGTYEKRHKLRMRLQKCVAGMSQRNTLLVGGDFNCPFESNPPCCGTCVLPHNLLHYKDFRDHQHVVESLHLCVLNTCRKPRHGQLATFTFGTIASQIDYILMRQNQVTPEAREAQVIANFPVAAWREGANHHPIEAYIVAPRTARQQHSQRDQSHTSLDRDTLLQDMKADTPSPALQALRLEAAQNIIDEDNANEVLLKAAHRCYPPPQRQAQPPEQPEALANCAKHMWAIFRRMKAQSRTAQGTFMAWRLWARF